VFFVHFNNNNSVECTGHLVEQNAFLRQAVVYSLFISCGGKSRWRSTERSFGVIGAAAEAKAAKRLTLGHTGS